MSVDSIGSLAQSPSERRCILLMGLTGAVGREILPRVLAADAAARVVALVRRGPSGAASVAEIVRDAGVSSADLARVEMLEGDLRADGFGWPRDLEDALAGRVTHVVHAAADTRLSASAGAEVAETNREGTRRVARFAARCARLERLVHVSSAYAGAVAPGVAGASGDAGERPVYLNPYERSKHEAEAIVREVLGDRAVIVKPGIVVGDQRDGRLGRRCGFYSALRALCRPDAGPVAGDAAAPLFVAPVDVVADATTRALFEPRRRSGCSGGRAIAVGVDVQAGVVVDCARRAAGCDHSLPFDPRAPLSPRDPLAPFLAYVRAARRTAVGADSAAERLGVAVPDPLQFLPVAFRFAVATDWLRRPVRPAAAPRTAAQVARVAEVAS